MGTNSCVVWTAYAAQVWDVCSQLGAGEGGCFTAENVASAMGRRVTHNLRRRLRELDESGWLDSAPYFTQRGGMSTLYYLHRPDETEEIPF